MAAYRTIASVPSGRPAGLFILSVLGRRPLAGWWTWHGGAGVEERRVYETAGKCGGYGDLNAAGGSILKPRLLSQVTRGLAKAVTARRRVQRPVDRAL